MLETVSDDSYVALVTNATNDYDIYAARADGGLDDIYYSGGWQTSSLNNHSYSVLAADKRGDCLVGLTIPEPGAVTLLLTALIGLICYAWKKRR